MAAHLDPHALGPPLQLTDGDVLVVRDRHHPAPLPPEAPPDAPPPRRRTATFALDEAPAFRVGARAVQMMGGDDDDVPTEPFRPVRSGVRFG